MICVRYRQHRTENVQFAKHLAQGSIRLSASRSPADRAGRFWPVSWRTRRPPNPVEGVRAGNTVAVPMPNNGTSEASQ